MSYSPVGDTVALTNLAYTLYTKVYAVAKNAPEQFGELSHELNIFKVVLFRIRDQVRRDTDSEYGKPVKDVLERCFQTLRGVRDLTAKYENLGWSDRGVWFKRLQWAKDQNAIQDFRTRFSHDQQLLQLILTSDGRRQLDEKAHNSPLLRQSTRTVGGRASGHEESCTCGVQPVRRIATTTTTDSRTLYNPRDDISLTSPELGRVHSPISHKRTISSTAPTGLGIDTLQSLMLAQRSQSNATSESRYSDSVASFDRNQPSTIATGISVGTDASETSAISAHTATNEPLNLPPDRAKHDASAELQAAFSESLEPLKNRYSTQEWLRLAMWWLVKSRVLCKLLAQSGAQRRGTDASLHDYNWESTISSQQAYVDLLKCSWILEEIVLSTDTDKDLASNGIRKMVKDLVRSLARDFSRRRVSNPEFPTFQDEILLKQDLLLIESFEQTVEAKENVPNAMDDLADAHRWLEVDDDNAGLPHERVKFRTFVNAQIGSRNDRSKSSTAPYMLLLWTTVHQSDLLVSLCNQQGTVNLSRTLFRSDLEAYESVNETTPFVIEFPSQEAEVMFLTSKDVFEFSEMPKQFFQAMKQREPHSGELAIFQAPLATYSESSPRRQVGDQQTQGMSASKTSSCGLRLYESVSDKCWKITRRLVVSSSPDTTDPRCVSHWLPLDCVRVAVEDAKATVSWSDCGQLNETGDGNFGSHYSYIYKPEEPNRKIHLEFRNALDARSFEQCLLFPTEMPPQLTTELDLPCDFQNFRTYRLFDVDEPDKGYHGIASTMKSPQGPHMTELFYIYRDFDWIIKTKNDATTPSIIEFPRLTKSHYISTVPRLQYKPQSTDPTPAFSHVIDIPRPAHLELGCDHDLVRFMRSLTGWTLKFYRNIPKLVLVDTSPIIRNNRQVFKRIGLQIWEKASEEGQSKMQLAVRLGGEGIRDRWITAALEDNAYGSEYHTVEVKGMAVQRGEEMDSKHMMAIRHGEEVQRLGRKSWKVQVTFEDANDKDEFIPFLHTR